MYYIIHTNTKRFLKIMQLTILLAGHLIVRDISQGNARDSKAELHNVCYFILPIKSFLLSQLKLNKNIHESVHSKRRMFDL